MQLYRKDGSVVNLATEEYVDGKSKLVSTNWGVGNYNINLKNVKCIILNFQHDNNESVIISFLATSYCIKDGINVTVNFSINTIIIGSLPSGYKLKNYLLIY